MNNDELLTALREQRTKVPMTISVEQVIIRGRAVRARRQVTGLAAALGAAAAAVIAVTALLPGHQASQPGIQLAAWTVVKQTDGNIRVTIRQWHDPAGLQRTLRADGVPARVTFARQENPACRPYGSPIQRMRLLPLVATVTVRREPVSFVIHPAALPPGAGLQITALSQPGLEAAGWGEPALLVQASPQCTGS
jgi:hypothetical protein